MLLLFHSQVPIVVYIVYENSSFFSRIHTYFVYRDILSEIYRHRALLCIFAELTVWLKERLVFTLVSAICLLW